MKNVLLYYEKSEFLSSLNMICIVPGANDELALKISLPVITVFIVSLLCAMAVVFYLR